MKVAGDFLEGPAVYPSGLLSLAMILFLTVIFVIIASSLL